MLKHMQIPCAEIFRYLVFKIHPSVAAVWLHLHTVAYRPRLQLNILFILLFFFEGNILFILTSEEEAAA